jgi:hypothetical protein
MAIILEGMDGTGKSTLSGRFGLPVIHPGAPPDGKSKELGFMIDQNCNFINPVIYDRVTCISQQVYRKRLLDAWYTRYMDRISRIPHCIVVYCRPPDEYVLDISRHTVSEHDTPTMLKLVEDNAKLFLESYDILMSKLPHIVYNYTSSKIEDLVDELVPTQYNLGDWQKCIETLRLTK